MPFLDSVNSLHGLLITFVIHKAVGSLFSGKSRLEVKGLDYQPLQLLSSGVAEKMLRVTHLLGMVIAGISAPGQDVLWITDNDEIAANAERVKHLTEVLARASSHCLTHSLRHVRVGTTKLDKGDLSLEDLMLFPT